MMKKQKGLFGNIAIPKEDKGLFDSLSSGELTVACSFLLRESKCSKCKKSYHICNCSKYLDKDVVQEMVDVQMLGPFWTNRKA